MTQTAFSSLPLQPALLNNLSSLGYTCMTPIQAQSLPAVLAGRDLIGQGKTGSGKTAAFALGILHKLDSRRFRVQALVLCPTRELADQVATEIRRLARTIPNIKVLSLCGGSAPGPQAASLEHGAHIVVGTPGRLQDHLNRGNLSLQDVNMLVLDEADRMLEMGFQSELDALMDALPARRQTLLFSATYPPRIRAIAERFMQQPLTAGADAGHDNNSIEQHFYPVTEAQRGEALQRLLLSFRPASCVVFCNTKATAQDLSDELEQAGFSATSLHGDLEQRERNETLVRFANGSVAILVATDVAARGLDIDTIKAVINYEIARDPEQHLHRIGRSGRAGNTGLALSLFSEKEAGKLALLDADIDPLRQSEALPAAADLDRTPIRAGMLTLQIDAGKKHKLRPGDVLGALTGEGGLDGRQVGKIRVFDRWTYVAVDKNAAAQALDKLNNDKLKGRHFRVRRVN
ncbi:ATP-dependent RNA helicase DbpA [Granulosicoccaceae sp. 1_MG-2023]|nr:ATP-dependent RNA helicase DbpA [Granulosicoccaceae sp. 1_MG-2023]